MFPSRLDRAEVLIRAHNMLEVRLLHQKLHHHNNALEQGVRERTVELQKRHLETIYTMMPASEHKGEDTGTYVQRISYCSRELAKLPGRDKFFVDCVFVASPMLGVGKGLVCASHLHAALQCLLARSKVI